MIQVANLILVFQISVPSLLKYILILKCLFRITSAIILISVVHVLLEAFSSFLFILQIAKKNLLKKSSDLHVMGREKIAFPVVKNKILTLLTFKKMR